MDTDGRLWIGEADVPGAEKRRWLVFSPDGSPEAELWLTALWPGYLPGNTELLAVSANRIAVLRKTANDEEFVEVWELLAKPRASGEVSPDGDPRTQQQPER